MSAILTGKVEAPDGEWLVGDALPEDHPGKIQPDDPRRLLFKVWRAGNSPKYARTESQRGWEPPLPAHDGRVERVQVFAGKFACETGGEGIQCLDGGGSVDLGPYDYRCWFLPEGSTSAAGIALCYAPAAREGNDFKCCGHKGHLVLPNCFDGYAGILRVHWKLITVFEGEVAEENSGTRLGPLGYAFFTKEHRCKWRIAASPVSFAVLYF